MDTEQAVVAIASVKDVVDAAAVRRSMFKMLDLMRDHIRIPPHSRVLIKVNLCLLLGSETGATVDPWLVRYLIEWLLAHYAIQEVIVAEADATHLCADPAFSLLGWPQILEGVPCTRFLNLSRDEQVTVELNGLFFKQLTLSKTFMEADYLISFGKLKTHTLQTMTCIMKNQFGALSEKLKILYHPHLAQVICDSTAVRPPDFCVVDALIAQEGPGPVHGVPRLAGLLIAGTDAVATDHACVRLIGKNPRAVPYLRLAHKHAIGKWSYITLGHSVDEVKTHFEFVPRWRQNWERLRRHLLAKE